MGEDKMGNKAGKSFAANLVRMMERRPDLDTQVKVAQRAGMSQTTVGRILKGTVSPTLDNVEAIALAFDKTIGDMIDVAVNPAAEIAYDRVRYAHLPKEEKARIESYIEHVIREHEAISAKELNLTHRSPVKTSAKKPERQGTVFSKDERTTVPRGVKRRQAV